MRYIWVDNCGVITGNAHQSMLINILQTVTNEHIMCQLYVPVTTKTITLNKFTYISHNVCSHVAHKLCPGVLRRIPGTVCVRPNHSQVLGLSVNGVRSLIAMDLVWCGCFVKPINSGLLQRTSSAYFFRAVCCSRIRRLDAHSRGKCRRNAHYYPPGHVVLIARQAPSNFNIA